MSEYNSQDPGKPQPLLSLSPSLLSPLLSPISLSISLVVWGRKQERKLAEVYARHKSEQMQKSKRFAAMATPTTPREERERARGAIERAALSCNSQGYPAVWARQAMPCERDEQRQQGWFLTFERRHFALPGYQDTYTNTPTPTHLCESHPQESEGWGLPALSSAVHFI